MVRIPEPGRKALARHMDAAAEEEAESLSGLEHVCEEPPAKLPLASNPTLKGALDLHKTDDKTNASSCQKLQWL